MYRTVADVLLGTQYRKALEKHQTRGLVNGLRSNKALYEPLFAIFTEI